MRQNPVLNQVRTGKSVSDAFPTGDGSNSLRSILWCGQDYSGWNGYFYFEYLKYGYMLISMNETFSWKCKRLFRVEREHMWTQQWQNCLCFFSLNACFLYQCCEQQSHPGRGRALSPCAGCCHLSCPRRVLSEVLAARALSGTFVVLTLQFWTSPWAKGCRELAEWHTASHLPEMDKNEMGKKKKYLQCS